MPWINPSLLKRKPNWTSCFSFFPFWGAKAPIFCMRWAPSAVAYHSRSDTFIINYMAAWWHQTLAWGMQWAVQGVLRCLAAQGTILITTRVSFKSISITHWPFSLLYFIWGDGWQRWLPACMQHIYGTAEITSRDLALSLSHRSTNGRVHITIVASLVLPIETTGDAETTISLDDDKACWTTPWPHIQGIYGFLCIYTLYMFHFACRAISSLTIPSLWIINKMTDQVAPLCAFLHLMHQIFPVACHVSVFQNN